MMGYGCFEGDIALKSDRGVFQTPLTWLPCDMLLKSRQSAASAPSNYLLTPFHDLTAEYRGLTYYASTLFTDCLSHVTRQHGEGRGRCR